VQTLAGDAVGKGDWSVDMVFIYAGSVSERLQGRLGLRSTTNKLSFQRKFDQRNSRINYEKKQQGNILLYFIIGTRNKNVVK